MKFLMKVLAITGFILTTRGVGAEEECVIGNSSSRPTLTGNSVLRPSISASISKKANRDEQGLVFGISQTLMSFATIVAPPFSGYLIEHGLNTTWCYSIVFFSLLGILFGFKCHFKQSHHNQVVESEG